MKTKKSGPIAISTLALLASAAILAAPMSLRASSAAAASAINLSQDHPATLRFTGSREADLFTRELDESFKGVLEKNFVSKAGNGFPAGFVSASLPGFPWEGTMWSRDGGTFMRELVMRGYYQHASLLADCLMNMVQKNPAGFYSFPMYFKGSTPGSGSELDGTASIVIGMKLLWERLPAGNPTRDRIQKFLIGDASPVNEFRSDLEHEPLLPGTGEFGCNDGSQNQCDNVVQNNLARLALLAVADMADQLNRRNQADEDRTVAAKIEAGMEKYLVDSDGSWIWCINPKTLKPESAVLNAITNRGTGSIDGVLSMSADVLGFQLSTSPVANIEHSQKAFLRLYNTPLRKKEFDHYGIFTQFDVQAGGFLSSPSYGQGYAIQSMLLSDNMPMAQKALQWLADATYQPVPEYKLHRDSPYYFYERTYSPDAVGKIPLAEGCGALNLVNVSEPLKVSRLMLGVDDHSLQSVDVIPRLPDGWTSVQAQNWPIRTRSGIVRASISYTKTGSGAEFTLTLPPHAQIDNLKVRMPSRNGYVWREMQHAHNVHFVTH